MANLVQHSGAHRIDLTAPAKKTTKKVAKHPAKKAAKKHAEKIAKKHAKKTAKKTTPYHDSLAEQNAAFHHMQRAASVISLMQKGAGGDLRDLLDRGAALYEQALEDRDDSAMRRAVGLLRAAEHLSLAGLYDARHKHRRKVPTPRGPWLEERMDHIQHRLRALEHTPRGKGNDLFPVTEELVFQAEQSSHDPHLAFELIMAADALCFALEHGL